MPMIMIDCRCPYCNLPVRGRDDVVHVKDAATHRKVTQCQRCRHDVRLNETACGLGLDCLFYDEPARSTEPLAVPEYLALDNADIKYLQERVDAGTATEAEYRALTTEAIRREPEHIAAIRSGARPLSDVFVDAPKKPPVRRKAR